MKINENFFAPGEIDMEDFIKLPEKIIKNGKTYVKGILVEKQDALSDDTRAVYYCPETGNIISTLFNPIIPGGDYTVITEITDELIEKISKLNEINYDIMRETSKKILTEVCNINGKISVNGTEVNVTLKVDPETGYIDRLVNGVDIDEYYSNNHYDLEKLSKDTGIPVKSLPQIIGFLGEQSEICYAKAYFKFREWVKKIGEEYGFKYVE